MKFSNCVDTAGSAPGPEGTLVAPATLLCAYTRTMNATRAKFSVQHESGMSLRIRCLYRSRESDARKRDERADVASNFDESWKADRFSLYAIGQARSSQMVERVPWRVKFVPA